MRVSDLVAQYICDMLDSQNGNAEIKRNELATTLGCVPSQINYVITSRFTPEQGYIVESRVSLDRHSAVTGLINSIGKSIDEITALRLTSSMLSRSILTNDQARLITAAVSEKNYSCVPKEYRDTLRASLFKNMLLTTV